MNINSDKIESNKTRSAWLDYLRICSTFAVIIIHVSAVGVLNEDFQSLSWWASNIWDSSARWCVPVFVMISGVLLLNSNNDESLTDFYMKRMTKILIPLFFWSLFYSFINHLTGKSTSISTSIMNIIMGKSALHLWYLYMLIGLYTFTPFIKKMLIVLSEGEFIILLYALFLFSFVTVFTDYFYYHGESYFLTFFTKYLGYYILAYGISNHIVFKMKISISRLGIIFIISLIFTSIGYYMMNNVYRISGASQYFYSYISPNIAVMSTSIFLVFFQFKDRLRNFNFLSNLSRATLGVYIMHPIFISIFKRIGISAFTLHPSIAIPALSLIVFILSSVSTLVLLQIPFLRRVV